MVKICKLTWVETGGNQRGNGQQEGNGTARNDTSQPNPPSSSSSSSTVENSRNGDVANGLSSDFGKRENRTPILTLDVQPNRKRFASGGQDGKIKIWNLENHQNEESNLLAVLRDHSSSVNCVRWSNDGFFLASGSDDCCVNLWILLESPASNGFGLEASEPNKENWKSVVTFKGHTMDVTGVAWSADMTMLASSSVDNTVRIWNVESSYRSRTFRTVETETVAILKGHSGWVKSVVWDPVGTYLASASDDRTVILWRCSDWVQEATVEEPFRESGLTTFKRQLSWSPDGVFLCMTHAYDKPRNVAYIVERNKWHDSKSAVRLVGHAKPVSLTRFSPAIYRARKSGSKVSRISTVCAIACNDRVLTVWVPGRSRPLVVFRNLFKGKILDLSWSQDGYLLLACSMDGQVVAMDFEDFERMPEVGESLSSIEVDSILRRHYGSLRRIEPVFAESTDQLMMEEVATQKQLAASSTLHRRTLEEEAEDAKPANVARNETNSNSAQLETVTREGKRRITPAFLSGPGNENGSSSSNLKTQLASPVLQKSGINRIGLQTPGSSIASKFDTSSPTSVQHSRMKRQRIHDPLSPVLMQDENQAKSLTSYEYIDFFLPADMQLDMNTPKGICIVRENGLYSTIQAMIKPHAPGSKRWNTIVKRFDNEKQSWRVKLDGKVNTVAGNKAFTAVTTTASELYCFGRAGQLLLPPIQLSHKVARVSMSGGEGPYLLVVTCNARVNVWNLASLCALIRAAPIDPLLRVLSKDVSRQRDVDLIPLGVKTNLDYLEDLAANPNQELVDVILSSNGAPVLLLTRFPSTRRTRNGIFEKLNQRSNSSIVEGENPSDKPSTTTTAELFDALLQDECAAFAYCHPMKAWCRIADPTRYIQSDFYSVLPVIESNMKTPNKLPDSRPLQFLQNIMAEAGRLGGSDVAGGSRAAILLQQENDAEAILAQRQESLLHASANMLSSEILSSPLEYVIWLKTYVTRLVEDVDIPRLREVCLSLLGPSFITSDDADAVENINIAANALKNLVENSSPSNSVDMPITSKTWKPKTMGMSKREILHEHVLPIMAKNRSLQRLVMEINTARLQNDDDNKNNNASSSTTSSLLDQRMASQQ